MSLRLAIVLGAGIFLLTALVRLPALVLSWFLPSAIQCQDPAGTLWQGACGQLRRGEIALSDVRWTLHPLGLLRARLGLDVQSDDPRASGRAKLSLHPNGDLDIKDLDATVPLQGGLSPLPAGWSGELALAIGQASLLGGHLASVQGTLIARQLHSSRPAVDLGSFELEFPAPSAGAPMRGTLHDLQGPLALAGNLQLSSNGAYELDGTVAARSASNTDLQQMLQLFGPPDSEGRHQFSLSGML
jgi:Type II secretion system (T2SS), protein N